MPKMNINMIFKILLLIPKLQPNFIIFLKVSTSKTIQELNFK